MMTNIIRNPIYLALIGIGALILWSMSVTVVPET